MLRQRVANLRLKEAPQGQENEERHQERQCLKNALGEGEYGRTIAEIGKALEQNKEHGHFHEKNSCCHAVWKLQRPEECARDLTWNHQRNEDVHLNAQ